MLRNRQTSKAMRFAVCGALAVALAACAGSNPLARAASKADKSPASVAQAKLDRAVAEAERVVAGSPGEVAGRLALGNAYLSAGRFDSAATTFGDAVTLGDDSAGTALRLALAQAGAGRNREAVEALDGKRAAIPASDYGLALALAGETGRGVAVLADALRGGENTPKLRQNLAYAYALDGRWSEARLMAAQDVPADQLDGRITDWAMKGKPEDHGRRIADMLGAPVRADEGQPVELALAGRPAQPQLAVAAAPEVELPPVAAPQPPIAEAAPVAPVVQAVVAQARPAVAATVSFDKAFAAPQPVRAVKAAPVRPKGGGTHQIQLGSFASAESADRATKVLRARHPELRGYQFAVAPAVVRGKSFWRVIATGFDQQSAFGACARVKTRGGACIAFAAARPLPGALPKGKGAAQMARR